ncbi:hypothetical protein ABZ840_36110 [Streptomyces sp. NPDC047117]|uniref:hypothetical protein n=1 Tax=Streptomyces sp. NPDC047117 TaxID=3155379 RepID=UPI0033F9A348
MDRFIGSGASDAHVKTHPEQQQEQGGALPRSGGPDRLLLRHAEETLFARYAAIRLESLAGNAAANSFYEACGWRHAGRLQGESPAKVEYVKNASAD